MACNREDSALEQAFNEIAHRLDSICSRMDKLEQNIARVKEDIDFAASNETLEEADEETVGQYSNTREGRTLECLDNFDFENVEKVMKFLEWTWASSENETPTSWDIKALAEDLFERAWKDLDAEPFDESGWREWTVATGGLEVTVCESDKEHGDSHIAVLKFVVEDWRAE